MIVDLKLINSTSSACMQGGCKEVGRVGKRSGPASPSTLGPRSPHTPHVYILLYGGFSMRHASVRCYTAERTRVN
jgi:hypothetical protein